MTDGGMEGRQRLSLPRLVAIIAVFLFVPQIASLFVFGVDAFDGHYASVENALASEIVPDLGGALVAVAAMAALGWTGVVLRERLRTRAWMWIVPISMVALSIALIDADHLRTLGTGLVVALAVGTLLTGVSEELMFRGIVLQALRDRYREGMAAALTAVVFGLLHLVNGLAIGTLAVPQALIAIAVGYLLYLCRRVSGGIAVPIAVHALYDFSIFSATAGPTEATDTDTTFYLVILTAGLLAVIAVFRRSISPAEA